LGQVFVIVKRLEHLLGTVEGFGGLGLRLLGSLLSQSKKAHQVRSQRDFVRAYQGDSSSYKDAKDEHPGKCQEQPHAVKDHFLETELKPEMLRLLDRFVLFVGAVIFPRASHYTATPSIQMVLKFCTFL
jgi:hypothetical protein